MWQAKENNSNTQQTLFSYALYQLVDPELLSRQLNLG
jgi:hypothetical protein